MATIKTILRPSTKGCEFEGRLCIRIIHLRKVKTITLPYKIYPKEWDNKKKRINTDNISDNRQGYLKHLQERLSYINSFLKESILSLDEQGEYSVEDILSEYQLRVSNISLSCYVEKICSDMLKSGQYRTARAYKSALNKFIKFNNGKDLPISDINCTIMCRFERELKSCGLQLNTISFYIRNIRVIYNKAIKDGYLEPPRDNPFRKVYTKTHKTKKRALSLDEINALHNIDFNQIDKLKDENIKDSISPQNEKLYFAWRLFFFCFYARGMSFVDLAYLRKENLQKGFINYYRRKSGQYVSVKITPSMQQIIESFAKDVANSQYVFPIIKTSLKPDRIQYESGLRLQNKRLRKLSRTANIGSLISTHVSRHSWASIAKGINLPISVISEGLGHANQLTTTIYLSSFNHSVLDKANDIITAAANNKNASGLKHLKRNNNPNHLYNHIMSL